MSRAAAWAAGLLLAAATAAGLWKLQAMARADLLAREDPLAALAIEPTHATALSELARRQLRAGDPDAATVAASRLLRHEPIDPDGWSVVARAAAMRHGDASPEALARAAVAVRHARRDLATRARLVGAALAAGDADAAMAHLDVMLRLSAPMRAALVPTLIDLAADARVRDALVQALARDPTWRPAMLAAMARDVGRPEVRGLYGALRQQGGLDAQETRRWLNALIAAGEWGAAYSHWASGLEGDPGTLAPVHNGGFEAPLSGAGFDWRIRQVPGSTTSRQSRSDAQGHAVRIVFQGRKVERAGLEQPLLLAPGRHRIGMSLRARNLRSELGLEWVVQCANGRIAGRSESVEGNFGWRRIEWPVEVPSGDCQGQWLRLRNPAPAGSARITRGELWVDDVSSRFVDAVHVSGL